MYQQTPKTLWRLTQAGLTTTLAANGDSTNGGTIPPIDLSQALDLALFVKTGTPGGTTPTLLVQVDLQDPDGNWITQVLKTASITVAGVAAVFGGVHIGGASAFVPTQFARIAWTVGGTAGPTWPGTQISLVGR